MPYTNTQSSKTSTRRPEHDGLRRVVRGALASWLRHYQRMADVGLSNREL
jgi:hypothetical protein